MDHDLARGQPQAHPPRRGSPRRGGQSSEGLVLPRKGVDPAELRTAVEAALPWLDGGDQPSRPVLAAAVRLSLRTLEQDAPGHTVEVRVPPFAAVQCVEGPRHTRGTPPNVVEMAPRTWLLLATGRLTWAEALDDGLVSASGSRADLSGLLPLVRFQ